MKPTDKEKQRKKFLKGVTKIKNAMKKADDKRKKQEKKKNK
jgi:hypothetical protein